MFKITYYELPTGEKPVEIFIDELEHKMQTKALASIEILRQFGNTLREPYSKAIGDGLFELRITFAGDITRIFYFFMSGQNIILTNGFIKKTPKTPPSEIALALQYKTDYKSRRGKDE